jgi:hypothetical protein
VKSERILNNSTAISPKPSFLLNERIYTKLTTERDQSWAIKALEAIGLRALTDMGLEWSTAVIYFIAQPKLPKSVRQATVRIIHNVLFSFSSEKRVEGADILVLGLEDWLRQVRSLKTPFHDS